MATIREISQQVDDLQAALDAEQEQIRQAIEQLNQTVAQLQQLVEDGGTAEERQEVVNKLTALRNDLVATVPDEEPEPDPEV